MNEGTIIAVNGWEGDRPLIEDLMWMHEQHECPIVVLSPNDSRITSMRGHICAWAGEREWAGFKSLRRQIEYYRIMLTFPWNYCLFHDGDSVCLSPEIPRYLYENDVLWSNEISDMMHKRPDSYFLPRIALQPPWFMSRKIMERLLRELDTSMPYNEQTPVIDWMLMAVCDTTGIPHRCFRNGFSLPTHPGAGEHRQRALDLVGKQGAEFAHTVKSFNDLVTFIEARANFLGTHPL